MVAVSVFWGEIIQSYSHHSTQESFCSVIHSFSLSSVSSPETDGGNVDARASHTKMVRHSFFQLVVLVTSLFLPVHCTPLSVQKRGACATEDPNENFLHEVGRLKSNEAESASSPARKAPIEIETWFHIVSSKTESSQVSDDMTSAQVSTCFVRTCTGHTNTTIAIYPSTILCRFRYLISATRRHSSCQRRVGPECRRRGHEDGSS